jgi:hypothetical protein
MRLPRMTTRRWMIAVAVVGLLMGGAVVGYRLMLWHDSFLALATDHGHTGFLYRFLREDLCLGEARAESAEQAALGRRAAYHEALAEKYRRAARYPWLPVEPDPPPPE